MFGNLSGRGLFFHNPIKGFANKRAQLEFYFNFLVIEFWRLSLRDSELTDV